MDGDVRSDRGLSLSRGRAPYVALGLFTLFLVFFGLGSLPLLDPDEARYADAAREMLERGDFVVPWFNGEMRLKKPPLFYWLQASSFALCGENEFAARLPSALAAAALTLMIAFFARRHAGRALGGLAAGAVFITMPLIFWGSHAAIIDMTLTLCVTATMLLGWMVTAGEITAWRGALLIGLAQGAGWLAKGPVAALAPVCAIVLYHLLARQPRRLLNWRVPAGASAVAAAIGLPWLLALFAQIGVRQFLDVVARETLERAESGLEHPQPVYFYLLVLPLAAFPWTIFFVPAFAADAPGAIRRGRPGSGGALDLWLWCWVAGMVLFFSAISGKLATYVMPALPAVALITARRFDRWSGPEPPDPAAAGRDRREWAAAPVLLVLLVALAFAFAWWDRVHAAAFLAHVGPFVALAALLGIVLVLCTPRARRARAIPVVAVALAGFYVVMLRTAAPEMARVKSMKDMVMALQLADKPDLPIAIYRDYFPSVAFYARRPYTQADDKEALQEFLRREGPALVIMDDDRWRDLPERWRGVLTPIARQDRLQAFEKSPAATPEMIEGLIRADREEKSRKKEEKSGGAPAS